MAKRALEVTRDEYLKKSEFDPRIPLINVSYHNVIKAFEELYNTKQVILLKSLRRYEVLVIVGIYLE